jgi:formiminotetrahydrofolate cyclodeaminase
MKDRSLEQFISELASGKPVPGGGGASALAASQGAALGAMAANITAKKTSDMQAHHLMSQKAERLTENSKLFLELIQRDADAFGLLMSVYKLPKDIKAEKIDNALIQAALPPMEVMRLCRSTLEIIGEIYLDIDMAVLSDIGCAAQLVNSACECAALNVLINARLIKTENSLIEDAADIKKKCKKMSRVIIEYTEDKLCG